MNDTQLRTPKCGHAICTHCTRMLYKLLQLLEQVKDRDEEPDGDFSLLGPNSVRVTPFLCPACGDPDINCLREFLKLSSSKYVSPFPSPLIAQP